MASIVTLAASAAVETRLVRLNSLGYLPEATKQATIAAPADRFTVVNATDGVVVWTGRATGPVHNEDTDEQLWTADFSNLRRAGAYRLEVDGVGPSAAFRIARDVYDQPLVVATRAMYLWRCGVAVRGAYGGDVFAHDACHGQDAWMDHINGQHVRRDTTGGWHDAGAARTRRSVPPHSLSGSGD